MDARRRHYLDALGVQIYTRAIAEPPSLAAAPSLVEPPIVGAAPSRSSFRADAEPEQVGATLSVSSSDADAKPEQVGATLSARSFRADAEPEQVGATLSASRLPEQPPALSWDALQQTVSACTACELHRGRSQTVFGTGDRDARWMIVGEAPGAEEDRQGEPFVGRAGQLLDAMLAAVGAPRERVYIANTLKCRPPQNRDPKADELAACRAFLDRQIALVEPELILVVGRIAAQTLLDSDQPIGKLRGAVHRYGERGTPLVATYHPAYLLRSPGQKRRAWDDLKLALEVAKPVV